MSEAKNCRLGLYVTEHSNCNHRMTLGSKGLIARDAFGRKNGPSVCLGRTCIVIMHTVHFSVGVSLWLDIVQCYGHPDTKACPPTPSRLFPVPPAREVGMDEC